jgi:phosphocarrier protein HPr
MPAAKTLTRDVAVLNRYGIHARPAALLVKAASGFACEILLEKERGPVNAKSIMGLLTLEGNHGAKLKIHATGARRGRRARRLADLFERKFFED